MQIILKSRSQFPHWVVKNVWFLKVNTIFKLSHHFWFKMEQTLSGFSVTPFSSASSWACFLCPFPGSCASWLPCEERPFDLPRYLGRSKGLCSQGTSWLDDLLIPRHFQRLITGKLTGVDPGRPQNLQRRKAKVTR